MLWTSIVAATALISIPAASGLRQLTGTPMKRHLSGVNPRDNRLEISVTPSCSIQLSSCYTVLHRR